MRQVRTWMALIVVGAGVAAVLLVLGWTTDADERATRPGGGEATGVAENAPGLAGRTDQLPSPPTGPDEPGSVASPAPIAPDDSPRVQAANEVYREILELTPGPGAGVGPDPERRLELTLHYLKHYEDVSGERSVLLVREAFQLYLAAHRFADARTLIDRRARSSGFTDWEVQEFHFDTYSAASDIAEMERVVQVLLLHGTAPLDRKLRAAFSMTSVLEALRRYGDARDLYERILDVIGTDESPAAQTGRATARAGIERMSTLVELTGR